MKTVTGRVISSKPISLSKAASTLSSFLSTDNGASPAFCAYLRRASASFNELKQLHKELKSSRSDRKHRHHRSEVFSGLEVAVDETYRSEASHGINHRIEGGEKKNSSVSESKSGKKRRDSRDRTEDKPALSVQSDRESGREYREDARADGKRNGNGGFEGVIGEDGKRRSDELKTEVERKPSRRVEMDVESSDGVKSSVAVESRRKKHKKKSEEEHGKTGDDERDAGARQSYSKSRISDNNGEIEAAAGDLVENNVARGKDRKKDKKNVGDERDKVRSEGRRRRDVEAEETADKNNGDWKDLVELPTKKNKKKREEDAGDLQNNSGGAVERKGMPVLDSKKLKRKEKKKRKNRDLERGGGGGSEEQQGTKRRKGNL
ncbi:nuclear speckle splicing regulatory protein 1 [Momordica charantia]|uniref:Nuclear speckle splicing regulatory protein 1 n=1 Tax=Momordica charantia TaxID=3673 RepID=A0A6J1CXN0_MOMCH|nr:nuclear speckle splicing regulatory protein 1 [Momordica charantia]